MKTASDKYLPKLFYGSSHVWALSKLKNLPKDAKVLDIGAGSGIIGKNLREQGIEQLCAVEPDTTAAQHCATIYHTVKPELASYEGMQFDAIVILDVLEHIPTPEDFFKRATQLLKPNGVILVSVPNLYHWSMRLLLLFGLLEYTDRGLFDRTHLQFFSQKRLTNLFAQGQITITERDASISPAEFVLPAVITSSVFFKIASALRLFCARLWRNLGAYQFLVIGVKS